MVWNLAALIAADCSMPDLAASLCERQFHIFQAAWPVTGRTAIASLQPLVNLARLTHRAGDPHGAYHALHAMNHAVHHGGNALVHGTTIPFDHFVTTDADRQEATTWLRAIMLEDGTRLLASTGQWTRAAAHAALYDDAGERLRESRQTQIIESLHNGHTRSAVTTLEASVTTEPWERAVAACLRSYIDLRTNQLTPKGVARALDVVRNARQSPAQDMAHFHFRLGLTAVDLATETCPGQAEALCSELIRAAAESEDAFAAREVLRHNAARGQMTPAESETLNTLVRRAGLGRGSIPPSLLAELLASVESTEDVLIRALRT
ncbi:hypothetical protein ACFZBP_36970 [Streptomyces sp. NPDC008086]|uniref:hypothetical protein n=1 Tax=Streptomyces sp. NPDC008086 TaxID=3364807 RepID=UPI0036E98621